MSKINRFLIKIYIVLYNNLYHRISNISTKLNNGIHPKHTIVNKRLMGEALYYRLAVRAWTVNSQRKAWKLTRMGINGIITDDPKKLIITLTIPITRITLEINLLICILIRPFSLQSVEIF